MSKYITCEFCKTIGKYQPECNCYREETVRNIARLLSCIIEESFLYENEFGSFLVQKFRSTDGAIFHMRTCIKGQCWRMIMEITEQEFLNYKLPKHEPRRELKRNSDYNSDGELDYNTPPDEEPGY